VGKGRGGGVQIVQCEKKKKGWNSTPGGVFIVLTNKEKDIEKFRTGGKRKSSACERCFTYLLYGKEN